MLMESTASHIVKQAHVILLAQFSIQCSSQWASVSVVVMLKVQPVTSANLCSGTCLQTRLRDAPAVNATLLGL